MIRGFLICALLAVWSVSAWAGDFKPYDRQCTERENVFQFAQRPQCRFIGNDRYEITFVVKGYCDVTVALVNEKGKVVRHLASGVLGRNAPAPFQKDALRQKIYWDGKNDLDAYVKETGKLKVRVMLGLKPVFDKLLGWNPYDPGGRYLGLAADEDGVLVMVEGNHQGIAQLRRFDHDGNYVKTIFPPSAKLPHEKMKGMDLLEYEPGKKALHSLIGWTPDKNSLAKAPRKYGTIAGTGTYLPPGGLPGAQQPCISQGWYIYANTGDRSCPVWLLRMRAEDGASDDIDYAWRRITPKKERLSTRSVGGFTSSHVRIAASSDKKWIYVSGLNKGSNQRSHVHGVYRFDATTRDAMTKKPFLGSLGGPGHDNLHFNQPEGVDCDADGNVYVCDSLNNRIQIFSSEGQYLRTWNVNKPQYIQIDRRRGVPYVLHRGRVRGRGTWRLTKYKNLEAKVVTAQMDFSGDTSGKPDSVSVIRSFASDLVGGNYTPLFALDVWSQRPRVWVSIGLYRLLLIEDKGKAFGVIRNFDDDAHKGGLHKGIMRARFPKVTCDPSREKVYYYGAAASGRRQAWRYDLKTGKVEPILFPYGSGDFGPDIAFNKRGLLYTHISGMVTRHDPEVMYQRKLPGRTITMMKEVPLDYGSVGEVQGAVATKDQSCAKGYQDGFGVNMRGDFVVESNIGYVPKMQDEAKALMVDKSSNGGRYAAFLRGLQERMKKGVDLYSIPREPGIRLVGGTLWVYDKYGELRYENIVRGCDLINGAQIDDKGNVYTVINEQRIFNDRPFLSGRATHIGLSERPTRDAPLGCLIKIPPKGARILTRNAQIKIDQPPKQAPNIANGWIVGAEWLYAGASGIVPATPCSCRNMRAHTDWFSRTFVPETYRHSVGVVDTAGNLIMHIGRYGNAESGGGPDSKVKVGGDEIAMAYVPYVSATDNYVCFSDSGNARLIVLKLDYHADESVEIKME